MRATRPGDPPHRSRVVAACAVLLVLAHLLLAQLTLVLALLFLRAGRVTRWRLGWLAGPAVAGLVWALAVGPGRAAAGFTAGPAHVLGDLGRGAPGGGSRYLPARSRGPALAAATAAARSDRGGGRGGAGRLARRLRAVRRRFRRDVPVLSRRCGPRWPGR